ncbi:MAG: L,D-transpeptidase [Anaerolineales bacterium]|nr:L,D-transpeptidase [Anaerolineales bacterium]MDW8161632.1 L,D-transpeptidase [Anaerolineales bacterium]
MDRLPPLPFGKGGKMGIILTVSARSITRREFLQICCLGLSSLAFARFSHFSQETGFGNLGRITIREVDLYSQPRDDSPIVGKRYRDQIVHIYEEVVSPKGPAHNPIWYRVWGGYLHSARVQKVRVQFNPPLAQVPQQGQLCEVTVPYTAAYEYSKEGWKKWDSYPLYYETLHWVTDVVEGPDRQPWYQISSELTEHLVYYVPATHLRPVADEEYTPLSPDVPAHKKLIEVEIRTQTLRAYEDNQEIFSCRVSTGIPHLNPRRQGIPTETPKGEFRIFSKMPNKHMGSITGNPDVEERGGFSLPGVPWTCFFVETGVAFHGTYWHNNFGVWMSRGCVNLRNEDAKWLFRWTTPVYELPIKSRRDWERRGFGTRVIVR